MGSRREGDWAFSSTSEFGSRSAFLHPSRLYTDEFNVLILIFSSIDDLSRTSSPPWRRGPLVNPSHTAERRSERGCPSPFSSPSVLACPSPDPSSALLSSLLWSELEGAFLDLLEGREGRLWSFGRAGRKREARTHSAMLALTRWSLNASRTRVSDVALDTIVQVVS